MTTARSLALASLALSIAALAQGQQAVTPATGDARSGATQQSEPGAATKVEPSAGSTGAASPQGTARTAAVDTSELDSRSFVEKAAQDSLAEVQLGELAIAKSSNEQIRKFAERMVQDHGKANSELAAIAKRKNLSVPKDVGPEHKKSMEQLRSLTDGSFDAAYAREMVRAHEKAIDLFKAASGSDQIDQELQGFATKTLPTLQDHKRMADQLGPNRKTAAVH